MDKTKIMNLGKLALIVALFFGAEIAYSKLSKQLTTIWQNQKRTWTEQSILSDLGGFNFTIDTKKQEVDNVKNLSKSDLQKALYFALSTIEVQNEALSAIQIKSDIALGYGRFSKD